MIVVSDASPIIALSAINHLNLLKNLYGRVIIPEAVYREICVDGEDLPGSLEVQSSDWIITKSLEDHVFAKALTVDLDIGEAEGIALAIELKAGFLLMDERRGRYIAERLRINVIGVLGILVEAKHKNLVSRLTPLLNDLINKAGFRISQQLYKRLIDEVGESILPDN